MKTTHGIQMRRLLAILICMTATVLSFTAIHTAWASQNNLVFILDASGSMWGQVQETAKIVIAKEVLTDLIRELPSETRVGLAAYGHRRKGDYQDVEELIALGALDKEKLITEIKAINPRGKTPITHSIQITAEKLKALEDETTIILVSDGKETCEGDPCALVKKLKQGGVKFILHVIGFDVTDEERSQLECIAEAGGGIYYTAKTAGEFRLAAKKVVKKTQTVGFLKVTAWRNGKPIAAPLDVYTSDTGARIAQGSTSTDLDQPVTLRLKPGVYKVKVTDTGLPDQPMVILSDIEIETGKAVIQKAEFSASFLEVVAVKKGVPVSAQVTVFRQGATDRLTSADAKPSESAKFTLVPGVYNIEVVDNSVPEQPAVSMKGVEIKAGETVEKVAEFILEGTLSITALKGGKPFRAHVYIYPQGKESYFTRKDTSKVQPAVFQLLPGIYDVKVEDFSLPDQPKVSLKGVEIKAGKTTDKIAEFTREGTLRITALKGGNLFRTHVYIYPEGSDSYLTRKDTSKDQPAVFQLLPGIYDVKVEDFSLPAQPVVNLKSIEIKAGETIDKLAEFTLEGILSVTAIKGGNMFRAHVYIYPEGSDSYLTRKDTSKDQPAVFQLLPGIYNVKVEDFYLPDQPVVNLKSIEIKAGETIDKLAEFTLEGILSVTAIKSGSMFRTHVYIYPQGEESYLTRKDTGKDQPAVFQLLPGIYDVKVEDFTSRESKEFKGIIIESDRTDSLEADF